MTDLKIKIGGSAQADATAFVEAWHRIERGDASPEHVLTFESWETLASLMTPERLRLLRLVHRQPQPSIIAVAKALDRQYRRVHDDVTILAEHGLLQREGGRIKTRVDRIEAVIEFA